MNITFLIGNGFDINMGLDTRFSDFLACYLADTEGDSEDIGEFKQFIGKQGSQFWSDAELAFGEYTDTVVKANGTAAIYHARHADFCRKLARYLQQQEARINTEGLEQTFVDALQSFRLGLTSAQLEQVNTSVKTFNGNFTFNLIIFNYTEVIDKIDTSVRRGKGKFTNRVVGNTSALNSLGKIVHVHGTTRKEMILGVNDASQIKNPTLFDGVNSAYINSLIKPQTNKKNESQIDEQTHQILKNSDLIYIYGMSLGATDAIWWKRTISAMKTKPNLHVMIYAFDAPRDTLLKTERWIYDDELKKHFLSFAENQTPGLEDRIHVISDDVFSKFHNIAVPAEKDDEDSNVVKLPLSS